MLSTIKKYRHLISRPKEFIFLILLVLSFIGCASSTGDRRRVAERYFKPRTVNASFEQVYSAATEAIFDLGYTMKHSDKNTGIIVGEMTRKESERWGFLAKLGYVLQSTGAGMQGQRLPEIPLETWRVTLFMKDIDAETTKVHIKTTVNNQPYVEKKTIDTMWLYIGREVLEKKPEPVEYAKVLKSLTVEIDEAPRRDIPFKERYAVVVGIEKYRDLPQVEFAQRDAQVVREYLINTMGFPEANIVTLLNERALRSDLGKYFETWLKNNVSEDSTVFIYYSGHGAPGLEDKAYLVPYDGDPNYPEKTCYPLDSLYASLDKLPAKEIIVAIDSCFSGAGGRSVVAEGARPVYISVENPMLASGNTVVLTAAAENEIASFYPEAKHGLFTYFFLRGLRGDGDLDGDGWVELKELFDYLKPKVTGIARRMNREQTPVILPSPETLGKRGEYRLTKAE